MKKIYLLASLIALLSLGACNYERSGDIASLSGNIKDDASYSFKFNGCTVENVDTFRFTDRKAGVKAKGTLDSVALCQESTGNWLQDRIRHLTICTECAVGDARAKFTYDSSTPRALNGGTGHACIGFSNTDDVLVGETLSVIFDTGRYTDDDYAESAITNEKIRLEEKECPDPAL